METGVKRDIDPNAEDGNGAQQLKRPRSQREPTKNFDRYSMLQEQAKAKEGTNDVELEESMSLFMDFVQAAASQKTTQLTSNGHLPFGGHKGPILPGNFKKLSKNGVRASVTVKGASTSKGSRPWTPAEEHDLMKLVEIYGNKRWSYIAQLINGRTGKQCRERWLNHLRPNIKKDEWTAEEERILAEGHAKLGTKWSSLAKLLPGRTENSIKNHWNATLRCKGRLRSSKGSSRGNKPGVLKEYMDSLQRGLTAEKAVEIACFAEKLSTALAKEQPKKVANGDKTAQYDMTKESLVRQEVSGMVALNMSDSREQLLDTEARLQEQRKRVIKNTESIYLTKRHMPHIDEWSFQYSDLGNDWAWYWRLYNHRANVKIVERNFDPTKDFAWPHAEQNLKVTQDALCYTAVGKFDKGISTSQYNSRALQCVLSACVFVVQRNEEVCVHVSIFLSKEDDAQDTLLVTVLSGGIGKTTGLQEMLRQIKTVLTLTANNDMTPTTKPNETVQTVSPVQDKVVPHAPPPTAVANTLPQPQANGVTSISPQIPIAMDLLVGGNAPDVQGDEVPASNKDTDVNGSSHLAGTIKVKKEKIKKEHGSDSETISEGEG